MKNVKIFTEQKRHTIFLKNLIIAKGLDELGENDFISFIELENLIKLSSSFRMNSDEGGINLVIVDGIRGYAFTKNFLEQIKNTVKINFEYFILPNNNLQGSLETLLYAMIPHKFICIKNCITAYEAQIVNQNLINSQTQGLETYNLPTPSGKVYQYLDAVLKPSDKELLDAEKRDYTDRNYWDIHAKGNDPLAKFLVRYLR